MNYSQQALRAVQQIEAQLLFEQPEASSGDPGLQLLGFCLRQLGQRRVQLEGLPNGSIVELLNHNDIIHRCVAAPRDPMRQEYPLLIAFTAGDLQPLALFRRNGRNWCYSPSREEQWAATPDLALAEDAYEIYLSLPATMPGPLSLLGFTFGMEKAALLALMVTSAVVMLFNLSIPMLTNLLVSRILPRSDQQLLLQGLMPVLLLVIGSTATQFLQNLMMLRLESVADLRLQTAVWDRLMRLPMAFISQFTTGDLASRVNAITELRELLGSGVLSTLLSSLFALSYFVLMFSYEANLALWATAFTAVAMGCLLVITLRSIRLQMPLLKSGAEIVNFSLQAVMGMPQIRSAGAEPFVLLRYMREINRYALLQLRINVCSDALERYATLVTPMASIVLFAIVTFRILHGSQGEAEVNQIIVSFIAFNAAFNSFNGTVTGAVNLFATVAGKAAVLWQRAEPVMYAAVEQGYEPGAIRHTLQGEFRLRGISYTHPGGSEPLFQSLTFTIESGQHTAITGPSGCGKSTLVRMLLGFIEPNAGELLIDGIPLHQLSIRAYRRQLGVVMQTARLAGSIYDIICGGVQRSEEEVWHALERAAIADEVHAMPMQLETLLSDSGNNISGGQVQRIAIARALIFNPRVLIMDEATSALDTRSELKITETIDAMHITRISIAHRLATIQHADQIVVLERGRSAEQGSWHDLKGRGYLARMLASR